MTSRIVATVEHECDQCGAVTRDHPEGWVILAGGQHACPECATKGLYVIASER